MNAHPPLRPLRTLRQPTRRPFLRHLLCASGLLAGSLLLAGCGGGSDSSGGGQAQVRALNLATDLPSVDLDASDVQFFGAVAVDELRAYKALDTGTYTLKVKRAGDGTTLLSGSYALSKDLSYTAVIWGRETALRLSTLPENETNSDIPSGSARVRIFNATVDTGSVDIFLTASTTDIGEAQATQASVNSGGISGYREISKGTYRLRVTGAGDPSDLRLDVAELTLGDQQHSSLILSPGASGMLVHATHLVQQGAQTVMKNSKARVRVVASVDAAGNVAATLGGRTLAGGLRSPSVGPYQLVDATSAELTLRVNGNVVLNETRSFTAGTDYTLLAHGSAAASSLSVLVDDNRLPSSTSRVKMRLLHGAAGVDPLTLSVDYLALSSDLVAGTVSAYSTLNTSAAARIDVTSAAAPAPLYSADDVVLQSQGVYTVFMLAGNATPTGVIRKER